MVSDDLKLGTRARQKIARRAAILAAAECALGSDGDVAVEEIASAAGLAKGTVYNYFPDKAALVEAVTQSVERRLLADIVASPVSAPLARLACCSVDFSNARGRIVARRRSRAAGWRKAPVKAARSGAQLRPNSRCADTPPPWRATKRVQP